MFPEDIVGWKAHEGDWDADVPERTRCRDTESKDFQRLRRSGRSVSPTHENRRMKSKPHEVTPGGGLDTWWPEVLTI